MRVSSVNVMEGGRVREAVRASLNSKAQWQDAFSLQRNTKKMAD